MKKITKTAMATLFTGAMALSAVATPASALEKRVIDETTAKTTTTSINGQLDTDSIDVVKVTVPTNGELKVHIADAKNKGLSVMLTTKLNPFYSYEFTTLGDIFDYLRPVKLTDVESVLEELLDSSSAINYGVNEKFLTEGDDSYESLTGEYLPLEEPSPTFKTGLKAGTYYLVVTGGSLKEYKDSTYRLTTKFEAKNKIELESNNDRKSATALPLNKTFTGVANDLDPMDYFKVDVAESGNLVLKATSSNPNADLGYTLYDANRKGVKNFEYVANRQATKLTSSTYVNKGTYYVRVAGSDEEVFGHSNYSLKANVVTKSVKRSNVVVKNAAKSTITLKALPVGATVNVYSDAKKKKKVTSFKATSATMTKAIKLNKKGGNLYVALKKSTLAEGAATKVPYNKAK
mgnify:FL=1